MQFSKTLIAAAAALASLAATAAPTATVGLSGTSFLTLASSGTSVNSGGTFSGSMSGLITGGRILNNDNPFADINSFAGISPTVVNFLAAGPTSGTPATFAFGNTLSTNFISFLWGSPDSYNSLQVMTTAGSFTFTAAGLGLGTGGSQAPGSAQFVGFTTTGSERITSLVFSSSIDAFEAADFSVTAAVPEPETYALLLAGLGVLGFVARRRRPV